MQLSPTDAFALLSAGVPLEDVLGATTDDPTHPTSLLARIHALDPRAQVARTDGASFALHPPTPPPAPAKAGRAGGPADTLHTNGMHGSGIAPLGRTYNSGFVQDTLFPLAGGPPASADVVPQTTVSRLTRLLHPGYAAHLGPNGESGGSADPATQALAFPADIAPDASLSAVTHEMGHLSDWRGSIPDVQRIADRFYPIQRQQQPGSYMAVSPEEYKAELFSGAMGDYEDMRDLLDKEVAAGRDPQKAFDHTMNGWSTATDPNEEQFYHMFNALLNTPTLRNTLAGRESRNYWLGLSGIHTGGQP